MLYLLAYPRGRSWQYDCSYCLEDGLPLFEATHRTDIPKGWWYFFSGNCYYYSRNQHRVVLAAAVYETFPWRVD